MNRKNETVRSVVLGTVRRQPLLCTALVLAVAGAVAASLLPPLVLGRVVDRLTARQVVPFALALGYFGLLALSGGLDSSLISAIADSHFTARGKTLQTFSVGYQDNKKYFHATHFQPSPDAPYIRTMNQFLNAQHTWVTLDSEALAAALLEALDPEQNSTFNDHFIDIPFDLSHVLFITTANDLGSIPGPLRDRMDVIELPSYTRVEKYNIARKHLLPKQLKACGLTGKVTMNQNALYGIIDGYTREAGVRNLERTITSVLRKCARKIASGEVESVAVTAAMLEELLGPRIVKPDFLNRTNAVGIANGLAWTSVGGETLPIELQVMDNGTGKITVTGSLGDVMKESAQLAVTWVRVMRHPPFPLSRQGEAKEIFVPADAQPEEKRERDMTAALALRLSELPAQTRQQLARAAQAIVLD